MIISLIAVPLLALLGWSILRRGDGDRTGSLPRVDAKDDPGFAHVHGLGIDPASGTLYAATHYGLFVVPDEGPPSRVANRFQDTMGFTVAGANRLLGSGHPDVREGLPSRLGLIESRDGGTSWQSLSLSGQADFHALRAAHGSVYGYDSGGRFMVSTDLKTWDTRSSVAMRDFAVSPADAETLLATTERGLQRSTDGGRTFSGVPSAPPLVVLGWATASDVYGVGPDGQVHHSRDGGVTWASVSHLDGEPHAFAVSGDRLLAATADGIFESSDGAHTWRLRHRLER
ncbi:MAG: F510_1955 family glycosylhydrolase [Mycobacteriales bacterium]